MPGLAYDLAVVVAATVQRQSKQETTLESEQKGL
jgi:hypothetical protein